MTTEIRKTERIYRLTDDGRVLITNRQPGFSNEEFDSGHRFVEHERVFRLLDKPSKRIWISEMHLAERSFEMGAPTREEAFEALCNFLYQRRNLERR